MVGLQLLIWFGTGLYFKLMDHIKASGNELRVHSHNEGSITGFDLFPIKDITSYAPQEVTLIGVLHDPFYDFVYDKGQHCYPARQSNLFEPVT
ncbi:NADH:ubiquinone oxidoreductase, partial [Pseudoalteromonas sp. S1650]